MAELAYFTHGWDTPTLALAMSVLGYIAGLMLAVVGRGWSQRRRVRVALHVAVIAGAVAIWLTTVIDLIGHPVADGARAGGHTGPGVDPVPIGISLACTLLLLGAGFLLTSYGRPVLWRLLLAGSCIGMSLASSHYVLVAATQAAGSANHEPTRLIVPGTVAVAAAAATLWFMAGSRRFLTAGLAALVMGAATTSAHYGGMRGIEIYLGTALDGGLTGVEPLLLLGPQVLVGTAVTAVLAFFSLGGQPAREHRAPQRSAAIEPRMIEEVTSRVTVTFLPAPAPGERGARAALPARRPIGPRPTPGNAPTWRSMPVWGAPEKAKIPQREVAAAGADPHTTNPPSRRS
jgi:NO-binding membrane sensor protein with MHYT domain